MVWFIYFALGCLMGSFLPCLAHQVIQDPFQWRARSRCDYCQHRLAWHDLFPLLSQLFLRSRCRYCQQPLASSYWRMELGGGCLAVGLGWMGIQQAFSWDLYLAYGALFCTLACMSACDMSVYWVPDRLQVVCLILSAYIAWKQGVTILTLWLALYGLLALLLVTYLRPHWLGGADIKLFSILWLSLQPQEIPLLLGLSAGLGLLCLVISPGSLRRPLPFVPAIALTYYLLILLRSWSG